MKVSHKLTLTSLLLLAVVGVAGLILTSESRFIPRRDKSPQAASADNELISLQFLNTARRLSTLATTPDELSLAQDALRFTDRELDKQFAAALQTTANVSASQTPAVRAIQERIRRIGTAIQAKQEDVQGLTEAVKNAKKSQQASMQQQLDVAQAELNLYKEALGDAQDDLIRAGGDPHSKIQQLVEEHQATAHEVDSIKLVPANQAGVAPTSGSLVAKFSYWNALRQKQNQILQAQQEAYRGAAAVATIHDAMEQQFQNEQAGRKGVAAEGSGPAPLGNQASTGNAEATGNAAAAISSLKRQAENRKTLAIQGRRIQNLQEVGSIYGKWVGLVNADKRQALHGIIASALWIILMLLLMILINHLTEHLFSHLIRFTRLQSRPELRL
jgi:hypothetical protein